MIVTIVCIFYALVFDQSNFASICTVQQVAKSFLLSTQMFVMSIHYQFGTNIPFSLHWHCNRTPSQKPRIQNKFWLCLEIPVDIFNPCVNVSQIQNLGNLHCDFLRKAFFEINVPNFTDIEIIWRKYLPYQKTNQERHSAELCGGRSM